MDTKDTAYAHDGRFTTQPILPLATTWMPCRHYAKHGKSENKRQLLYGITYTRNLKNTELVQTEQDGGYQGLGWEWGDDAKVYTLTGNGSMSSEI